MNLKTFKQTDLELVNEVVRGNAKAQETLYNKYQQKLTRYLKYRKYNSFDLEDCVSEILIKIFENIHTYDNSKSCFSTWVWTITNNHIANKSKSKHNTVSLLTFTTTQEPLIVGTEYTNDINYTITNNTDSLADASSSLNIFNSHNMMVLSSSVSNADFGMLTMKYVDGCSYREIACDCGLSSSTVASNRVNYIKTVISKNKEFLSND